MKRVCHILAVVFLLGAGPASLRALTFFPEQCAAISASKEKTNAATRLHQLLDAHWRYTMEEFPETATAQGWPGRHTTWTDYAPERIALRKSDLLPPLQTLATIDRTQLEKQDQLSYDLFKWNLEDDVSGARFNQEYMAITQMGGVPQDIPQTLLMMPAFKAEDFEDMIARLELVPGLIRQVTNLLQKGLDAGIMPPQITLREVSAQIRALMPDDPWESPLMKPFAEMPSVIPSSQQAQLQDRAISVYRTNVVPTLQSFHRFFGGVYYPAARISIGLSALPKGKDWYSYKIHSSSTTALTPEEIHQIGLKEVKRLRGAMNDLIAEIGYKGDFSHFAQFLRSDPQFFYENAPSLLEGYRDIAKRADPMLLKLFGHLPRLPYGVVPVPAYSERSQTTAYYEPGALLAGRPAFFYANTFNLKSRPKWEMEALTLHEAVPGHHLQISIAQELDLPEFRRNGGYTAFVEGWGLYAESLGAEMGFYTDPYSRFGQLTYEMWRAIRLVLDTGIHAKGWTRDEAITYFRENSSKTDHDILVEVDRYISWPGQAVAYKLGQLKIRELRTRAESALGARFDVRAFHDAVLGNGAMPLDLLEKQMDEWVSQQK